MPKKMFKKVEEVALAQIAQRLKDNKMPKKMFQRREVALAQIAQRLKDNEMPKKMLQVEKVALARIAQRLESNFVPAAIPPSIVDRWGEGCAFSNGWIFRKSYECNPQECASADWSMHKRKCKAKAKERRRKIERRRIGKKPSEVDWGMNVRCLYHNNVHINQTFGINVFFCKYLKTFIKVFL